MANIDISGNEGVFLVFRNRDRLTWYNTQGVLRVTTDDATVLTHFQADTSTELKGFTVFQPFTNNPNIGGFEPPTGGTPTTTPTPTHPQQPTNIPQQNGFRLQGVVPCADELAEVFLESEDITRPDENKVEFQLMLFSITDEENLIKQNQFSTCEYKIKDLSGKEWVRMSQTRGTKSISFGGLCGNNHPQKKYLSNLTKDCCVYLPRQTYVVQIKNTSANANILGWVHHPHLDAGETARDIFRGKLEPNQISFITIDASEFSGPAHRNAIKINGNAVPEVNP